MRGLPPSLGNGLGWRQIGRYKSQAKSLPPPSTVTQRFSRTYTLSHAHTHPPHSHFVSATQFHTPTHPPTHPGRIRRSARLAWRLGGGGSRERPSELWSTLIHDTHRDCVNIWTNIAADAPLTLTRALRPHEDEGINSECLDGYYQKVPLAWLSLTRSLKHIDADRGSAFFSHGTNSHVPPVTVQDPLGVAINPTPTKTDASD